MPTLTVGSHGEVIIPKAVRDQLNLKKGSKVDYGFANNMMTLCAPITTRTKMDDEFDRIRDSYLADGITLDTMMSSLQEIYNNN